MSYHRFAYRFRALGSINEIQLYESTRELAETLFHELEDLAKSFESKFSRYKPESVVSRINRAAGREAIPLDEETLGLIQIATRAHQISGGLFDITSGVLRQVWDFSRSRLPEQREIDAILPRIGFEKLEVVGGSIRLTEAGMEIDFGGIGKEYLVDKLRDYLNAKGVTSALVNCGGDVAVLGPHPDGAPWSVGIRHPRADDRPLCAFSLLAGSVATSGDYERFIEVAGKRFCHIINPRTGWPTQLLQAATVLAPRCVDAGILSTTVMLQGPERGRSLLRQQGYQGLLVCMDGTAIEA